MNEKIHNGLLDRLENTIAKVNTLAEAVEFLTENEKYNGEFLEARELLLILSRSYLEKAARLDNLVKRGLRTNTIGFSIVN